MITMPKQKKFEARIKYPSYFTAKDFWGSWHKINGTSASDVEKKILKGTTGLSKRRVQVRQIGVPRGPKARTKRKRTKKKKGFLETFNDLLQGEVPI